jgi:GTP cyclohydrolase I
MDMMEWSLKAIFLLRLCALTTTKQSKAEFISVIFLLPEGKVVGLSKLNRIVEYFGRRGTIQEQYTVAVHNAVNKICEGNQGVAVMVEATHNCVSCRGVKHAGASMKTSKLSGCFIDGRFSKSRVLRIC